MSSRLCVSSRLRRRLHTAYAHAWAHTDVDARTQAHVHPGCTRIHACEKAAPSPSLFSFFFFLMPCSLRSSIASSLRSLRSASYARAKRKGSRGIAFRRRQSRVAFVAAELYLSPLPRVLVDVVAGVLIRRRLHDSRQCRRTAQRSSVLSSAKGFKPLLCCCCFSAHRRI